MMRGGGRRKGPTMAMYVIERNYAERIEPHLGAFEDLNRVNDAEGVRWLYSFLSLDQRKTYCLYEAASAEVILSAAALAGVPADRVVEVVGRVTPDGQLSPVV